MFDPNDFSNNDPFEIFETDDERDAECDDACVIIFDEQRRRFTGSKRCGPIHVDQVREHGF